MALRAGTWAFAAIFILTGLEMALAPRAFFTDVGPFGTLNAHYMRDLATFEVAYGVMLALAAARRTAWRTPLLMLGAIQGVLHAANHLRDIAAAHPYWLGPFNFATLVLAAAAMTWLARESTRPQEARR